MQKFPVPDDIKSLARIFSRHGHSLYLVGGAIRDYLLRLKNDDYDFSTDATPSEVVGMFPSSTLPTGIKHGTVTVRFKRQSFEITTFRAEGDYSDSRHPDNVTFVRSIESDLERRDFTINAFACDALTGEVIDMHGGMEDLKAKAIRAIGNPEERFREDALRMLRACRFSAKLGFGIEEKTLDAMKDNAASITKVSAERIREELFKTLMTKKPSIGLEYMRVSGLLWEIIPEMKATYGCEQGGFHKKDVYGHTLAAVDASASHDRPLEVRIAMLLHDIGKPSTKERKDDGSFSFYRHEIVGSETARKILLRLKCPNSEIDEVAHLVKNHMYHYVSSWSDAAIRRFIRRIGVGELEKIRMVHDDDNEAIFGKNECKEQDELFSRINSELAKGSVLSVKDLKINGDDLMEAGIEKGPKIGKTLSYLLEMAIDDPSLNEKETLLSLALGSHLA